MQWTRLKLAKDNGYSGAQGLPGLVYRRRPVRLRLSPSLFVLPPRGLVLVLILYFAPNDASISKAQQG